MSSRMPTHWLLSSIPLLAVLTWTGLFWDPGMELHVYNQYHRYAHPQLAVLVELVTDFGNPLLYLVFLLLFVRSYQVGDPGAKRFVLLFLVVQIAVAILSVTALKTFIGRPRPGYGETFRPFAMDSRYQAFPSGHTSECAGSVCSLSLWKGRIAVSLGLGLLLAAVGYSRIYLGQHHPGDVFAGWVLGSLVGWTVMLIHHKTTGRSQTA